MRRARVMLVALLDESDAPKGEYLFGVTDLYPPFEKLATARLEVERGRIATAVLIRLRSRSGSGGSIVGSLYLPSSIKRDALFKDMEITAENFNRGGGWVEALQNLAPNPSPRDSVEARAVLSVPLVSAQQVPVTLDREATSFSEEVTMSTLTRPEMLVKLAEFLVVVARESADSNGVFPSEGIARFSKPIFPSQKSRWLGQGILFELERLGWMHHVAGKGQYQVDPAFATKHSLGLTIRPLPRFVRGQGEVVAKRIGPPKQGLSLETLLEQQRELERKICEATRAKQRELTEAIEKARADVLTAEQRVVEAEAQLVAHNEEYAHLLEVTPPSGDSETPLR